MNYKQAAMAGTGSNYSWAQLFNPFSVFMGGGDRYPEFVARMFPYSQRDKAWMVSKIGAVSILAAALAGGTRALQHASRMQELAESDAPTKNIRSDLGTTFNIALGADDDGKKKKKSMGKTAELDQEVEWPAATDIAANVVNTGLPIAAFALAAAAAYKGVDAIADKRRVDVLDDAIVRKRKAVKRLMQARAQQARGTISDKEVDDALAAAAANENYIKTAQDEGVTRMATRDILAGIGLLMVGLTGASAIGAYKYFSASDPANIKYKAIKKGLKEYAKTKAAGTPLTIVPTDAAQYFGAIAGGNGQQELSVRQQPEITQANKPISITL